MSRIRQKFVYITVLTVLAITFAACGSDEAAEPAAENEAFVLEAQAVAEATPTPLPSPSPTATPQPTLPPEPGPTATLMTELVEPVSPVASGDNNMSNIPENLLLPGSETAIQAAIADLAAQLAISPAEITVAAVEAQQWSDASLGCPEEGMMYAQVITPGFLITLEANGQSYTYHTNEQDTVVLCDQ